MTATCAFEGNPLPEVQWIGSQNSVPIQNNSRIQITHILNYTHDDPKYGGIVQSRLMIKNLSLDEAGEYQCIGNNTLGIKAQIFKVTIEKMTTSTAESSSMASMTHNGKCLIFHSYP